MPARATDPAPEEPPQTEIKWWEELLIHCGGCCVPTSCCLAFCIALLGVLAVLAVPAICWAQRALVALGPHN